LFSVFIWVLSLFGLFSSLLVPFIRCFFLCFFKKARQISRPGLFDSNVVAISSS